MTKPEPLAGTFRSRAIFGAYSSARTGSKTGCSGDRCGNVRIRVRSIKANSRGPIGRHRAIVSTVVARPHPPARRLATGGGSSNRDTVAGGAAGARAGVRRGGPQPPRPTTTRPLATPVANGGDTRFSSAVQAAPGLRLSRRAFRARRGRVRHRVARSGRRHRDRFPIRHGPTRRASRSWAGVGKGGVCRATRP